LGSRDQARRLPHSFPIEPEEVRAFSSSGEDWTNRYRRIVTAAGKLDFGSALIDGEMVVQDERGVSDFEALRGAIAREPHRLVFFAFDLIHLDGEDLRGAPLDKRKGERDPEGVLFPCGSVPRPPSLNGPFTSALGHPSPRLCLANAMFMARNLAPADTTLGRVPPGAAAMRHATVIAPPG
jgi:hypothetical protein